MATEVDICNIGLGMLGANQIADFNDGSTEALLCKLQYPLIRDAVLESRAWTFATTRKVIASGVPPDPIPDGWGYAYPVPNDCIRIIQAYVPNPASALVQYVQEQIDGMYTQISWERLKGWFYCNSGPTVWAKYIVRITDTQQFDSSFIQALATRIAMDLAMPITNNETLLDRYTKLFAAKIQEASGTEGQQGTTQKLQGRTLAARRV